MKHLVEIFVLVLALTSGIKAQTTCPNTNPGDNCFFDDVVSLPISGVPPNKFFVIGGLFDVHAKRTNAYSCKDGAISDKSILNVLAFFWAVNHYGNQTFDGKGVSVGAFAFDNCFRPDQTVGNLLGFSQCKLFLRGIRENVVAYVGPYTNEDAERTGMLASDLSLTLVSPDANSYDLDYKSLLRMRPNFDYDLMAIFEFLKLTGSKHVLVVYCDYPLYIDAHESFMKMAKAKDICVNRDLIMPTTANNANMDKLVTDHLIDQRAVKYLVPLMCPPQFARLMKAVARNSLVNDRFVYIVTSDIGRNREITTDKVIVVEPSTSIDYQFNAALQALQANRSDASLNGNFGPASLSKTWLNEYLKQSRVTQVPLLNDSSLPSTVSQSVTRTIMAVRNIITGMDNAMSTSCSQDSETNYQLCDVLRIPQTAGDIISTSISNAAKLSDSQPTPEQSAYNYFVYRNQDQDFIKIGTFNAVSKEVLLTVPSELNTWYEIHFKSSACPDAEGCCLQPTASPMTQMSTEPEQSTAAPTAAPTDDVEVTYPRGQEITGAFALDVSIERNYETRFENGHKWVIALGVLAGLGMFSVLVFEIYIMYKLIGTRMGNKWRTMWLGQLLLFGIFLAYLTLVAYIFVPTDETCGITRFGVGVSYAICFAVLLVKLMVILTSKSSDVLLPGDGDSPNYLKGVYQFLMFIFAVGIQVVINAQWLITVPPEAVIVLSRSGERVWVCNHYTWKVGMDMFVMKDFVRTNFENHLLSLVYIMGLILITTILSLKAHGIITNHRESVFIGIAAGFSIPIWLAWGLVGGLNIDHDYAHEFGDACIAFGLLLTVTLIMFAMFLPKVRQLVNMGVEGIYLEDDRDTYYAGSVIMSPPSYKSKGPSSVIYVNNQGIYSEPVVIGNGDPSKINTAATHLKHPGNTYSSPPAFLKKSESTYGGSRVLRMTDDLKGRHPQKKTQSEVNYGPSIRSRSYKGTLPRSRSQSDLGAL